MNPVVFDRRDPAVAALPCLRPGFTPELHDETIGFWQGGAEGELRIWRCESCGFHIHPPAPRCSRCQGVDLHWSTTSGVGEVFAFTVNHQRWHEDLATPYIVAIVELADQIGLKVTTNLVGVEPDEVTIGLPVQAAFVRVAHLFVPVFVPRREP